MDLRILTDLRILLIHKEQPIKYGAHYINDLLVEKLRCLGALVDTIYPKHAVDLISRPLKGIGNILFFFSLAEKRKHIRNYDIIQGTTYTTLPFLGGQTPVISHFGSTTFGFLKSTPTSRQLREEREELADIFSDVKRALDIRESDVSMKSLRDINRIELYVAKKSDLVVATSERVKQDLVRNGVPKDKVIVIHNAIEDYWFDGPRRRHVKDQAHLVYIGRMGDDAFTIRLKGINRLVYVLRECAGLQKTVIGMCRNIEGYTRLFLQIPNTDPRLSVRKAEIPALLTQHYGDVYINPGRYEGFCLSLVEAMSQGLVPVVFPIGVAEEIIEDGRNGYLVHSVEAMVEKVNFLKGQKALRARMAREAALTARRFTADAMLQRLRAAYDRALQQCGRECAA